MATIIVPKEYGYVIASGVLSIFVATALAINVGKARKEAKVPYPYLYAAASEVEKDPKKNLFNCVQRGHQNMMEIYPQFLFMLTVGGLKFPLISAAAGGVWSLGRYMYAQGYSSGDPSKRSRGSFAYIGYFTLLGTTLTTAYQLVTSV